jgi:hypothetical protein
VPFFPLYSKQIIFFPTHKYLLPYLPLFSILNLRIQTYLDSPCSTKKFLGQLLFKSNSSSIRRRRKEEEEEEEEGGNSNF